MRHYGPVKRSAGLPGSPAVQIYARVLKPNSQTWTEVTSSFDLSPGGKY